MKRNLKIALALIVLIVAGGIAVAVFLFTRPFALRRDLEMLMAGRLNSDSAFASEVCGTPVHSFISPTPKVAELRYGEWPWAAVELQSWKPFFSKDGMLTARVSGVGADLNQKPLTDSRTVRVRFSYHCAWDDNGRSNEFRCSMPDPPLVVRE